MFFMPSTCGGLSGPLFLMFRTLRTFLFRTFLMAPTSLPISTTNFQTLPSLRSFCLYCAVGMTAVYFFQATFFVACLAIDQRRIEQQRNGLLPCFRQNLTPRKEETEAKVDSDSSENSKSLTGKIFRKYGEILVNPFAKVSNDVNRC